MNNRIILTDVDGVLLEWEHHFSKWMLQRTLFDEKGSRYHPYRLLEDKEDIGLNNFQNWDSMQHVKILINISKKFKIKVNTKNSNKFNSYQSGIKYLRKTKNLYNQT